MFCEKCGANAGEGIFCTKCGSRIIPETPGEKLEETEVKPITGTEVETELETEVETIVENKVEPTMENKVEPTMENKVEPTIETAEPILDLRNIPEEASTSFDIKPPVKKSKKWLAKVGIVAAILVVLGTGIYFAYPMIIQAINPKAYAVSALKNTTSKIQDNLSEVIENTDLSSGTKPQEFSVSLQLDKLDVDDISLLSEFKERNITMNIKSSTSDNVIAGTFSLGSSSTSAVSIEFYMDESDIIFKIPDLSSQTFSVSVSDLEIESNVTYSDIFGTVSALDSSQVQKYMDQFSGEITAVVQDVINGIDTMIESGDYKKVGNETYDSANGDIKVSVYDITFDQDAIKKGAIAVINNLFNDSKLSSYVNTLSLLIGLKKEDIISEIKDTDLGIENIQVTVYINKSKEIVKAILDLDEFVGEKSKFSMEFIGTDSIYDYIVTSITYDGTEIKSTIKNQSDEFYLGIEATPDQTTNKGEFLRFGIKGKSQTSDNNVDFTIDNLFVVGNLEDGAIDLSLSGKMTSKSISSVTSNLGSSAPIIWDQATATKKTSILTDMSNNITKLKGKLSDITISVISEYIRVALAELK